jgi:putative CocE/NonD family hydrolase
MMLKKLIIFLITTLIISQSLLAQDLTFKKSDLSDTIALADNMQILAKNILLNREESNSEIAIKDLFRIEILANNYQSAITLIQSLRDGEDSDDHPRFITYEIYSKAKIRQRESASAFKYSYASEFSDYLQNCSDKQAYSASINFTTYDQVSQYSNNFKTIYNELDEGILSFDQTLKLLKNYFLYHIYLVTEPIVFKEINTDENRRYLIDVNVLIRTKEGAEISAIVVRKKGTEAMPAVLYFTIYADPSNLQDAIHAASKGYVGIFATSRGKRFSKSKIDPYKHEYKDVYATIDWISKQEWNNGKVGMYGGSYGGFTQWASVKEKVHPALKTIVPSVAVAPGIDLPMENNVFLNFSYSWIPYVTNNKFLDKSTYYDSQKWDKLQTNWFTSGKPYNKIDSIEGNSNKLFQEWISHPSYDNYWKSMIPYKEEFAHIDIPILTITGYYDDGQRGAMYYYKEHIKYNSRANHYLLIGPYDHWGAQFRSSPNLRGYQIDPVANINIMQGLIFEWFDYTLKGKEKPSILKGKVNFQVMCSNTWINKASYKEMSNGSLVYFLSDKKLVTSKPEKSSKVSLEIDLKDRSKITNADYYPFPIIKDSIDLNDGLVFTSKPFEKEHIINGSFSGELKVTSNKKDFDYSVNLYEQTSEGKYFHLSYYIGRASYAKSTEKRELLRPDKEMTINFNNTSIVSKKLFKGSKLVVVFNGNKNPNCQINYGTGKEVTKESIEDAGAPLKLRLNSESKIEVPIWNNKQHKPNTK